MAYYRTPTLPAQRRPLLLWRVASVCMLAASGCAAGARTELAAADAIDRLCESLSGAVAEYHVDMAEFDDSREAAAARALGERLRQDATNEAAAEADIEAFLAAMAHLRADRSVDQVRFSASTENIATLREVAAGLRRLAIDSMSLDDEMRRYLLDLSATWRASSGKTGGGAGHDDE